MITYNGLTFIRINEFYKTGVFAFRANRLAAIITALVCIHSALVKTYSLLSAFFSVAYMVVVLIHMPEAQEVYRKDTSIINGGILSARVTGGIFINDPG